jgi:superfamily II DNA or RNA helicase
MKEYEEEMFESFGLVVIDEVHHISSQVFSSALFRIVTKYMLGLSATMNRKDGTTYVFKMFLGNVVYKGDRDEQHDVVVRAITYRSDNPEFNHVETNYIGEVKYSTMISKLCSFQPRSDFIVDIVRGLLTERPGQQIMILAHNKNLLKYLHDAIQKFIDTGYYIGGMKEASLKESEGKSVVIATYSMAAEALDIKTLTTLVMATPRTDVEQAVGRILRMKHGHPVVVDIVDTHSTFQNQFKKRKKFYDKEGYRVTRS